MIFIGFVVVKYCVFVRLVVKLPCVACLFPSLLSGRRSSVSLLALHFCQFVLFHDTAIFVQYFLKHTMMNVTRITVFSASVHGHCERGGHGDESNH